MKLFKSTVAALCALALLCVVGGAAFVALELLFRLAGAVRGDIPATTAAMLVVILAAALVVAWSIRGASKRSAANQLLAPKAATYQLSVALWERVLLGGANEQGAAASAEELQAADRMLALYGSAAVIKAHAALRAAARAGSVQAPEARALLARALFAMRKDLGAETWGLKPEELSRLMPGGHEEADPAAREAFQGRAPRVSLAPNS